MLGSGMEGKGCPLLGFGRATSPLPDRHLPKEDFAYIEFGIHAHKPTLYNFDIIEIWDYMMYLIVDVQHEMLGTHNTNTKYPY